MFFSHWYFCYTLKMSAMDTNDYLEFLFTLEEDARLLKEKDAALDWLDRQEEPLLQAYAVPLLVNELLKGNAVEETLQESEEQEWRIYLKKGKKHVSRLLERTRKTSRIEECLNLIQNLDDTEYGELVDQVLKLPYIEPDHKYEFTYLESEECAYPIVLLSVLCVIAKKEPQMVWEAVTQTKSKLVSAALDRELGCLPWKLAMILRCYCGMSLNEAEEYFPEHWFGSVECLEIAALQMLLKQKGTGRSGKAVIESLIRESYTLEFFERNRNEMPLEGFWINEKADYPNRFKICAVLWQNILWNTAFEYDAAACAELHKPLWNVPVYGRIKRTGTKRWRNLLIPLEARVADTDTCLEFYFCTPWQKRTQKMTKRTEGIEPFQEFRDMVHNESAFRIFAATILLRRMMGTMQEFPIEYCRILLNMGDVFQCDDVNLELAGEQGYWENAIVLLGYFAKQCIGMLGRGELNDKVPQRIIAAIHNGRENRKNNEQLNEQYRITGIQVCAHWAVESMRAGIIRREWEIESPWFSGGQKSGAVQLCKWFFEDGINRADFDYRDPILLCFQAFPEEYRRVIQSCESDSWIEKYRESEKEIGFCDFMLSGELFLEEWEELGVLKEDRFDQEVWRSVLTMRLLTLLRNGKMKEHMPWYTEWRDEIAAHVSERDADGVLFYLLCELMSVKFSEGGIPRDYQEIIKLVIGTIHSYTTESTIFYQYYLTSRLEDAWERYGQKTGAVAAGENIRDLYGKRQSAKERELLAYSLARAKKGMPGEVLNEIYKIMKDYWEQQCASSKHHAIIQVEKEEWNPLTDFALQENNGQLSVMRPVQNMGRVFRTEVKDLFKNPMDAESEGWYVGIITNESYLGEKNKEYFVQFGAGRRERCTSSAYYRKGETVGIKLDKMGKPIEISKLAWKDDVKPIEVNLLELSAETLKLRLPNGDICFTSERNNIFHTLLNLWEPDISTILQTKAKGGYKGRWEWKREVCYDQTVEFYVPVKRDFQRLILECFFSQNQFGQILRLTFIQEMEQNGKRRFLFSADAGINYLLSREDWEQNSFERLEEKLQEGKYRQGLIVLVCLEERGGFPILSLAEEMPFDEKNWEWDDYFTEEDFFVVRRAGEGKDSEWYAEINVAGMPERVKADFTGFYNMGGQAVCNVQLYNGGWSTKNQRHGVVRVENLQGKSLKETWCTQEGFRQLREIEPGNILMLENSYLRRQREGYHSMQTESRLPVLCAAESLSLVNGDLAAGMISGRACVVEYVDLWEAKKVSNYKAVEVPILAGCGEQVEGIVSQFSEELNTASEDARKRSLGVWLKLDNKIVPVAVPVTAFESWPKALGAPVVAVRQSDGKWLFRAYIRKIQVRALWKVEERKADRNGKIVGIRLGKNMNIPGYGQRFVTQAKERPILYLWGENTIQKGEEDFVCGVGLGRGRVSKVKRRNFSWDIFPYAKYKDLVRLAMDGMEFYGDSAWGEFDDAGKGANWSVNAAVFLFRTDDGREYYDLRRNFYCRSMKLDSTFHSREQDRQLDEQYERWINEGDYHVIGAIVTVEQKQMLKLKNLKVPQIMERKTLRDKWTDTVSLAEDDPPWVLGRYYPKNRVRALMIKNGDTWIASCHEAEPFLVDEALAKEFNIASGDIIRRRLYYAGLDENNRLRFEWGRGFTFLVDEEDIVDEDGHKIGNNLFYGDMIEYFTMVKGTGTFGWHICVEYKAITRQVEGRVWNDSFGENPVVQLLEIQRDLEKRKISIKRVSVTEETIQKEAGLFNRWDFQEISSARLEKESINALLEEEGYEQNDTKIIFAQLNPESDKRNLTCLTFRYVPVNGKRGDTWLLEGQVVCLVAGEITSTGLEGRQPDNKKKNNYERQQQDNRLGNDYMLSLYLPNELPNEKSNPQMRVNVLRREFSVDESKLRTLYPDYKEKYYGCKMIVRLKYYNGENGGKSEWKGNIISTPKRARESLETWVASQEHCLVTLGIEKKQLLAEVAPGIISHIPQKVVQGTVSQGALALLWIEGGELKGKTVLPGDGRYLPYKGRPAELLIMDGAAKNYFKLQQEARHPGSLTPEEYRKAKEERNRNNFTVAGLPQLLLADRELLEKKICEPIPRLAYLVKEQKREKEGGIDIYVWSEATFCAARLYVNQEKKPELHYFYPEEQVKAMEWGDVSFLDGTISELVAFTKRGRWHYHDRKAAFYHGEKNHMEALPLPDGKKYNEIILFPDRRGWLRYRQAEFLKHGFPAREVIENGLPQQDGEYPVAGVTEESIWIEVFPGKLTEIPTEYLFAGEKKVSLSGLWTGMLFPGDRIRLCQDEGFAGNQRKLILRDVIFGARAGLGERNTFLPIQEVLEDGLVLGTELWKTVLPVRGKEKWTGQKYVCASQENLFAPMRSNQMLFPGDVLMVSCDRGYLSVLGWESLKVRTAYRDLWENAEWLLEDVLSRDGKGWMKESCLTIPMEIRNTKIEDGVLNIWVFYRQPDMDALPCGTKLCCICAGLKQGKDGEWEMVMRTGKALLSIPAQQIIPGVPKKKMPAVAKVLRKEKMSFWIHKEEDGWHSGLRNILEREQPEILLLFCVEEAKGIMCLTKDNMALRWLPGERAARAGKIAPGLLWNALCGSKDRCAKRLDDGSLSLVETWQNEQKYEILKCDGTRYRATPVEKVYTDREKIHCYLAELFQKGDVIRLYSEKEYDCAKGKPIPIEIGEKGSQCVTAFPYGMRRRVLHLTPWVYKAIGSVSVVDSFERFNELGLHQFPQEIPECFESYRQMPDKADRARKEKKLDYELLQNQERTSEQLIYLYEVTAKGKEWESDFDGLYEFIRLTLKAWVGDVGRFLASGLDKRERRRQIEQIDIAPVIAAILLLNTINEKMGGYRLMQAAKPLAVHLLRMLGTCCGSSIHQEILLKQWLLKNEKRDGLWLRLNQLSLRGEDHEGHDSKVFEGQLTPEQIRRLLGICSSLKMHTFQDKELELVVESILLSVGCLEDCDTFYARMWPKKCITEKLSIMGRILTPSAGNSIARNSLSMDDVKMLRTLFLQLLQKDSLPLSLVTDTPIPIPDIVKSNGIDLCENFCKLVSFYKKEYANRERGN